MAGLVAAAAVVVAAANNNTPTAGDLLHSGTKSVPAASPIPPHFVHVATLNSASKSSVEVCAASVAFVLSEPERNTSGQREADGVRRDSLSLRSVSS